jgi:glycosyltransferase involved in cell wall biosynthesis
LNILVLASDIPATSRMPGSPRLFSLCRVLARRHHLFLATHCSSRDRLASFSTDPSTAGVFQDVTVLTDPPPPTWWGKQKHRLRQAPSFVEKYRAPDHYRGVLELIAKRVTGPDPVDLLLVDGLVMSQYAAVPQPIPVVLDVHDSPSLLYATMLAMEHRPAQKLALRLEAHSVARLQRRLGRTCDLIITNSPVDEAMVRRVARPRRTLTIPNGVDTEYFTPTGEEPDGRRLVLTGVMNYAPNEDAAVYFCEEILPLIRRAMPDVEFWAVGSDPTPRVRELARQPGVHVTGLVDDVRPYVRSAAVFVCPLRGGAGMKNKLLAAMAMRRPVVATRLSLEGLEARPDEHVLVADQPEAFAAQVQRLLADSRLAQRLADDAHAMTVGQYSWDARGAMLEEALRTVAPSVVTPGRRPQTAPSSEAAHDVRG